MPTARDQDAAVNGNAPKRPPTYDEAVDEAPDLIEAEPVEIERGTPAAERNSVESVPTRDDDPPLFED